MKKEDMDMQEISDQYRFFKNRLSQLEKPLTKQQEFELSQKIKKARARLYFDIFGYLPYVEGIVSHIQVQMEGYKLGVKKGVKICFKKLVSSTKAYRKKDTVKNRNEWAEQRTLSAIKMAAYDTDNLIAVEIITMIQENNKFGRNFPPKGSQPFFDYKKKMNHSLSMLSYYKNKFMKANVFLVLAISRKYIYYGIPFGDLVQEGMIGLMKGIERFDATKGYKFSTYGTWWIRHAISRFVDNKGRIIRVPCHMAKAIELMNRTRSKLATAGIEATPENIAEAMGISKERVENLIKTHTKVDSLDFNWENQSEAEYLSPIFSMEDEGSKPDELLEEEMNTNLAHDLIQCLDPKLQMVIEDRFGFNSDEELRLREVGEKLGVSRERVRQLQNVAIDTMRKELEERKNAVAV